MLYYRNRWTTVCICMAPLSLIQTDYLPPIKKAVINQSCFSFPDEEKSAWIEFEDLPCTIVFLLAMQKDYSPITALSQPLLFSKQNIFWKMDSQNLIYYFQYWFKLITFICLLRTLKPVWKYKIYWLCFCTIFLDFINLYDRRNSLIGEKFALTW